MALLYSKRHYRAYERIPVGALRLTKRQRHSIGEMLIHPRICLFASLADIELPKWSVVPACLARTTRSPDRTTQQILTAKSMGGLPDSPPIASLLPERRGETWDGALARAACRRAVARS
jgi:hypothetical protein